MTDSAGVVLVDNGRLEQTEVWSLESSPAVTIGGIEEHGGQPLFRVSSAIRLSSGRIAVADAGALQIFLYTAAGQFLRAFGREGDGPGEFSAMFPFISLIELRPDSLIVDDGGVVHRQRSIYTAEGEFVRELPAANLRTLRGAWFDVVSSPRGAVFAVAELDDHDELTPGVHRGTARVIRLEPGAARTDTVAAYPGTSYFYADVGPMPAFGGGAVAGPRAIQPLFAPRAVLGAGGNPFVIAAGDQAMPVVELYDEAGKLQRRVRWSVPLRRPGREDLDSAAAEYRRRFRIDPQGAERAVSRMPAVDHTPVFRRLVVDHAGNVWVEQYPLPSDSRTTWWVFASDGRYRSLVSSPRHAQLLEVGEDYVLLLARDELDVQRVELWRLVKAAPVSAQAH